MDPKSAVGGLKPISRTGLAPGFFNLMGGVDGSDGRIPPTQLW